MNLIDQSAAIAQLKAETPTPMRDVEAAPDGPMAQRILFHLGCPDPVCEQPATQSTRRFLALGPVLASFATGAAVVIALAIAAGSTVAVRDQLTPTQARAAAISALRGEPVARYTMTTEEVFRELEGERRSVTMRTRRDIDAGRIQTTYSQIGDRLDDKVFQNVPENTELLVDGTVYYSTPSSMEATVKTPWFIKMEHFRASTSAQDPNTAGAAENSLDGSKIAELLERLGGTTTVEQGGAVSIDVSGTVRELRPAGLANAVDAQEFDFDPIGRATERAVLHDPNALVDATFRFDSAYRLTGVDVGTKYRAALAGLEVAGTQGGKDRPLSRYSFQAKFEYPRPSIEKPNRGDVTLVSSHFSLSNPPVEKIDVHGTWDSLSAEETDNLAFKARRAVARWEQAYAKGQLLPEQPSIDEKRVEADAKDRFGSLSNDQLANDTSCTAINPYTQRVYGVNDVVPPPSQTGWTCVDQGLEYQRAADGGSAWAKRERAHG